MKNRKPLWPIILLIISIVVCFIAVWFSVSNMSEVKTLWNWNGYTEYRTVDLQGFYNWLLAIVLVVLIDLLLLVFWIAGKTKAVSIVAIVFLIISIIWSCGGAAIYLGMAPNPIIYVMLSLMLAAEVTSFIISIVGIVKADRTKADRIKELEKQIEELKENKKGI